MSVTLRLLLLMMITAFSMLQLQAQTDGQVKRILSAQALNATSYELKLDNNRKMVIDFYGPNIFRIFIDSAGKSLRDPVAKPVAQILVDNPRKPAGNIKLSETATTISLTTEKISIRWDKTNALLNITNLATGKQVLQQVKPVNFEPNKVSIGIKENTSEYFYGGGVQNGRFSHKGKSIAIENQSSWTDGGVASPAPFYWSTNGYAIMWYSFKKGRYDYGAAEKNLVNLYHETDYADFFIMVNDGVTPLLNDYYQLTGNPVLLPKFAFYQGHLNAYNRDYWAEDTTGIVFEDGKKYKESQKDNGGIKESLNGELNNYQFSARGVIDRYKNNDMPLGWILPNDGYGAGYGQTGTLDSNILNLKAYGDYARKNGVEIGLWTQSDLHPKPDIKALLQRDIVKEVRDAGVRVLKTDVAWVGPGYSFGLNGIADVAKITAQYGNNARPFIISLNGWAGTQRYAGIWTGDQTGGIWEYIRFHIPTYIGAGLSGLSNITSDMDGIFGGKNVPVNVRDFQWKTFTPMQLNMDGWGSNPKYPEALGEPATSINRNYLKLKSELMPYAYSIAKTAVDGFPMVRAMFLEYPNAYTLGTATKYQYMYGPWFLVAPIYKNTNADTDGNDIRNGIYLPQGSWIDYFTGEKYEGNRIINYYNAPLWKLPVFVKPGAIIPMANPNNNVAEINKTLRIYEIYPAASSAFTEYDDDGVTESYKLGKGAYTNITAALNTKNEVTVTINPATGAFDGMVKEKTTQLKLNVSAPVKSVTAKKNNKKIKLKQVRTLAAFEKENNVWYYEPQPNMNSFSTKGTGFETFPIYKNPQVWVKLAPVDITATKLSVNFTGFSFAIENKSLQKTGALSVPANVQIADTNARAFSLKPSWAGVANADFYEIEFNNMLYSQIKDNSFEIDELQPETGYTLKLRAANKQGYSNWVDIKGTTKINPLQFAIQNIAATATVASQGGEGLARLFDFDPDNNWHTRYGVNAIPFDLVMDLKSVNQLDKLQYLPRSNGRNGIISKGTIYYSTDKKTWTAAGDINWEKNNDIKEFAFGTKPVARYIKLNITEGVGNFGSGREIYVFKVPGSASYIPGDINNDGKIDNNDFISYTNYTGLRKGDGDFDGYIINGDINKNNLIDAYDISNVTVQLGGGVNRRRTDTLAGKILLVTDKTAYKKDELIEITVKGEDLKGVNALSFALAYNTQNYEYVSTQTLHTQQMENLTYDRLHSNGSKSLYPTFVNIGDKPTLNGNNNLFIIKLKAKRDLKFDLKITDGILVDKELGSINL